MYDISPKIDISPEPPYRRSYGESYLGFPDMCEKKPHKTFHHVTIEKSLNNDKGGVGVELMYAEGKMKAEGVAESLGKKMLRRRCRREMAKRAVHVKAATIRQACEALVYVTVRSFRLGLNRLPIACFLWRTTSEIGELGVFPLSLQKQSDFP